MTVARDVAIPRTKMMTTHPTKTTTTMMMTKKTWKPTGLERMRQIQRRNRVSANPTKIRKIDSDLAVATRRTAPRDSMTTMCLVTMRHHLAVTDRMMHRMSTLGITHSRNRPSGRIGTKPRRLDPSPATTTSLETTTNLPVGRMGRVLPTTSSATMTAAVGASPTRKMPEPTTSSVRQHSASPRAKHPDLNRDPTTTIRTHLATARTNQARRMATTKPTIPARIPLRGQRRNEIAIRSHRPAASHRSSRNATTRWLP
mmetsp:Transcript_3924/g.11087  ORF Transcript_3924/g.11087 Transcript_3924/m.11087 type:complete len:257 (+) Transcript_3924:1791-2561(+)